MFRLMFSQEKTCGWGCSKPFYWLVFTWL